MLPKVYPSRYSLDDAKQVGNIVRSHYTVPQSKLGVFGMLLDFAKQALTLRDNQPKIQYEQVLRWRHTTHPLGTLPFVCAFLADCDQQYSVNRTSLSINPMLQTDNIRINAMLKKGMAENHFHLKGSAPSFLLSWVCLMNDVTGRKKNFDDFEKVMLGETVKSTDQPNRPLRVLVMQAAAIRALLFMRLMDNRDNMTRTEKPEEAETLKEFQKLFQMESPLECETNAAGLQAVIRSLKMMYGAKRDDQTRPDYAMDRVSVSPEDKIFDLISGEVHFLYRMFRAIFERDTKMAPYFDLFYAYLLISIRFRAELTQNNLLFGFANFSAYDDRKGMFIEGRKPFDEMQKHMAAAAILNDKRYTSLEARIVPKDSSKLIWKLVHDLDDAIKKDTCDLDNAGKGDIASEDTLNKMFYVLHIPKVADKPPTAQNEPWQYIRCRDYALRKKVQGIADAVIRLRGSGDRTAKRIRGMDACANEADARPEVFSMAFRQLKAHRHVCRDIEGQLPRMLNVSYHVGEDFPDVVDGLRAVWEALEFMELNRNDRIGHGLALGIDAMDWYELKQNRIYITRQALLDNCAWMLEMLKHYNLLDTHLNSILEDECATQHTAIYQGTLPYAERNANFEPSTYFRALELRGDDPFAYFEYQDNKQFIKNLDIYKARHPFALRCDDGKSSCHLARRHNVQAIRLFFHYHFNPDTKRMGNEVVEYYIPYGYAQAVVRLQAAMRMWVSRKGIGVETNPSSNVLIGNFNRYDKHPLITFHDAGLFDSPENPNMFVSINTDDQGVFDTSLENEYALIARGLEQLKNPDGTCHLTPHRIYTWLNHVREMGLEQSFLND